MTYEEFIHEFLELVREIPDDEQDVNILTGFLNEQLAYHDFQAPLEEFVVIIKFQKPAIANYLSLFSSKDFKQLLKSPMTFDEALVRLGQNPNYFQVPTQSDNCERNL